jgi:LacI family transcriptional regulator, galactose operon repressor
MMDNARSPDRGFIRGLVDYLHQRGSWSFYRISPLYLIHPFFPGRKENIIDYLTKGDADGFFGYLPEQKDIQQIITAGFPAVIVPVKKRVPEVPNIIDLPNEVGIVGAEYFLDRGYLNLAFCGSKHYWSTDRQQGFYQRVAKNQITPYIFPLPKHSKTNQDSELKFLGQWLSQLPKPVGVMACNDDRAFDVLQACQKMDLKVPGEVAVLGVDNDEMVCNLVHPPLSSIELNFEKTGYEAAKLLYKMILNQDKRNDSLMLRPTRIVTRQSTDMIAVEDQEVAKALGYIRLNAKKEIQVKDVVETSSISRRALQLHFRNILGRSIHEEIRRARINQVAESLLQTTFTIQQIAQELDFQDMHHIARAFRKEKMMSPSEFRKIHKHD